MAELPLDKAYLTAIWLETLFYGTPIQRYCSKYDLTFGIQASTLRFVGSVVMFSSRKNEKLRGSC